MYHTLSGLVVPKKLEEAKKAGTKVPLETTAQVTILFVPNERLGSLVWNGAVNEKPALLILSICSNQSLIGY